ncbi:Delta-sarcoglycan [Lamellibrachia satsuma]|nr:Delta-sarcoglycan [Lamellibrachia satsuma]
MSNWVWSQGSPHTTEIVYKIGIYGWRKRCIYLFIVFMMATVIVNMALTIWILRVLHFSIGGMGKLRIRDNGVRVEGNTEFLQSVSASQVRAREGSTLYLESSQNITINARDSNGAVTNRLFMGDKKVVSHSSKFEVRNMKGKLLLSADSDSVYLGAEKLSVAGSGGTEFTGSIQTPLVRADASNLRLESPTKQMLVSAAEGVDIHAPVGGVFIKGLNDIKIQSLKEAIRLDAKIIKFKNLPKSFPAFDGKPYPQVYQLCVCGMNGKLFMAPSRGNCQAVSNICS